MSICTNCNGGGLVGQGPEPWLKIGHVGTCPKCAGTGNADGVPTEAPAAEEPATPAQDAPVDSAAANLDGGSPASEPEAPASGDGSTPPPSDPEAMDLAGVVEKDGPFSNNQTFEVGQELEFFITNPEDKYCGKHVVVATRTDENGNAVRTDRSGEQWIHVHWFQPVPSQE